MAETCLAHAALVRKDDPELSRILERRAILLEGPRAPSFGDGAGPTSTESPQSDSVALEGPLPTDDVEIDGAVSSSPPLLVAGEHHVRVLRRGRLAWAGWVAAEADPVVLSLPPVVPCSDTDFDRVTIADGRVNVRGPVLCPRWAVARDTGPTSVEVARCERSSCGTLLPWSRNWGREFEGPMQPKWEDRPSYAWLPWTALGVAVTTAAGIVLYRSGVFDREGAPRDTVTFSGPAAK
jgi:hypothetical protein